MPAELNRRLTTQDASFLYLEKPNEPMHIGSCAVYEGDISADTLTDLLRRRLHRLPRYRQRVVFAPLAVAHPTWEDDPDFDIRNHIEEIELSATTDRTELGLAAAAAFAGMLDRERPLWKLILLRGLEDGKTALISKVHHAMVDGASSVELTLVMHDLVPEGEEDSQPATDWTPRPLPDSMSLFQDAVRDRMTENAEAWADAAKDFMHPAESVQKTQSMMRALSAAMPSMFQPQPSVPWNGPLTATRNLAWVQFPFHEVRQIKSVLGGTVNDLALAILSGGLGRYLRSLGQSTESLELRAMCPVSMRRPDEQGQLGNLVSTMIAPLHVGILDPVERLSAEREAMEHLKQVDQAGGFYLMAELGNRVPPAWQSMAGLFSVTNTLFHTVSTNVPGPQIPLYLAGSELLHLYPLGPLAAGLGLFVAILSYNQVLTIGLTVEPNRIPDPWALADHLREAFEELRAAADIEAETRVEVHAGEPSRRKPRRGKKKRGTGKRKRSSAS